MDGLTLWLAEGTTKSCKAVLHFTSAWEILRCEHLNSKTSLALLSRGTISWNRHENLVNIKKWLHHYRLHAVISKEKKGLYTFTEMSYMYIITLVRKSSSGNWWMEIGKLLAIICLSDNWTIAYQCAIRNTLSNLHRISCIGSDVSNRAFYRYGGHGSWIN